MILQPNTSEILLRAEFASIDLVKKDLLGAFSVIRKEEGEKRSREGWGVGGVSH